MENVVGEEGKFGHVEQNGILLLVERGYENVTATAVVEYLCL